MRYIKNLILLQLFVFSPVACSDSSVETSTSNVSTNVVNKDHAQYLEVTGVALDDTLNLRQLSSSKSETVFMLPPNANGLLKLNEANGWVQLSYKAHTGWAFGKYLKSSSAPNVKNDLNTELFCIGTEPHWILKTDNHHITYKKYDDEVQYVFNSAFEKSSVKTGSWSFSAVKQGDFDTAINVVIKHDDQCSDEMSDNKYSYSISVQDKEMGMLNGCCK